MNETEIERRVRHVVSQQIGRNFDDCHLSAKIYSDLHLDSLDGLELVIGLEDEFGLSIPDEDIRPEWTAAGSVHVFHAEQTVADIVKYIQGRLPA